MRAAVAVAVGAAFLSLLAPAAAGASTLHLRVSPLVGEPDTVFRVGLNAPVRLFYTGPPGRFQTMFVDAVGPCGQFVSAVSQRARRKQRLRFALVADQPLCPGLWRGTVSISYGSTCDPEAGPCSLAPSLVKTVGRFSFVVSGSAT